MTDFDIIKKLFNITENNGFSADEISVFKRVCENIPKTLYDYYFQLGKAKALNQTQDSLIVPSKLKFSKTEDYLIFYAENQWACVWGISKSDLDLDDPPVYMSYDEKEWGRETSCLTDFFKAMANLQAVFALPFSSQEFLRINKFDLEAIRSKYKKREFCFSKWIGIEFYGNNENDVIAVMKNDDYFDLIFASNDEEQFKGMNKILSEFGGKH